jgi:hypothetical protein
MIRYRLILRPLEDESDPQGIRRLRRGLKHLLRACRIRCERVEQVETEEGGPALPAARGCDETVAPDVQPVGSSSPSAAALEPLRECEGG